MNGGHIQQESHYNDTRKRYRSGSSERSVNQYMKPNNQRGYPGSGDYYDITYTQTNEPTADTVFNINMLVPLDTTGIVIGKGGQMLRHLRETYDVKLAAQPQSDMKVDSKERGVQFVGKMENIGEAQKAILEKLSANIWSSIDNEKNSTQSGQEEGIGQRTSADSVTRRILVPTDKCGYIIGRGGSKLTELTSKSGAFIKVIQSQEMAQGSQERLVIVNGTAAQVTHAIELLRDTVNDHTLDQRYINCKDSILIPFRGTGWVVGTRGQHINEIRNKSKAHIQVLNVTDSDTGANGNYVIFDGTNEAINLAKKLVLERCIGWENDMREKNLYCPSDMQGLYDSFNFDEGEEVLVSSSANNGSTKEVKENVKEKTEEDQPDGKKEEEETTDKMDEVNTEDKRQKDDEISRETNDKNISNTNTSDVKSQGIDSSFETQNETGKDKEPNPIEKVALKRVRDGEEAVRTGEKAIRLAIPSTVIGLVIGKGGQALKEIQDTAKVLMKVSQQSSNQHSKTTSCAVCLLCGPLENLVNAQRLIYEKIAIGSKPLGLNVSSSASSSSTGYNHSHHDDQGSNLQSVITDLRYQVHGQQTQQVSYAPSTSHPSSLLHSNFNPNYTTNSPSQQSSAYSTAPPSTQPPHGHHQTAYHQHLGYAPSNVASSAAGNNPYYSSANQQLRYDYRQPTQGLLPQAPSTQPPQAQYSQSQPSYGSPVPSTVPPTSAQTTGGDSKRAIGLLSYNSLYNQIPSSPAPNTQPPRQQPNQSQYYNSNAFSGSSNKHGY